ncbi:MAG: branched-chain-amino-acid transaminase [Alicyclobacillus herbarius]|uniref:branched-chain-amino-acid transaminase n=1 Tax=Alicyclobacillus herbarius TaxID=122960 RepID=UPI0023550D08|nr:branched-chain-amino-acid transaminase [Alicyclobacillus herbarius]MCL6632259.1 branched-chain-amino-acid transaminase [Alicyclobacillus herbarius]
MGQTIFLNGDYVDQSEAKVSVYDHGLLYGDGIFEGIRVYGGNVFRLREHLVRLYESAQSVLLQIPYSLDEMEGIVVETVRRNALDDAYIRLVVTRGVGDLGLDPWKCHAAEVFVIAEELAMFPKELYEKGIDVVSVPTRRNRGDILSPKVKSLNYLNNILIKIDARVAGAKEALVLNTEGYVVEGSGENVFIVKNGVFYTPPTYLGALAGITRQAVMEIAEELGYMVKEEAFNRHDVYVADEVFLTGTAAEIVPVVKVDGRVIGNGQPGLCTKQIHKAFRSRVLVDGVQVYPDRVASITPGA